MMGDYHVRFCEGLGGKFPWSTRQNAKGLFCLVFLRHKKADARVGLLVSKNSIDQLLLDRREGHKTKALSALDSL